MVVVKTLMQPAEVLGLAFIQDISKPISSSTILATFIKAAEIRFIEPLLSTNLYEEIYANYNSFDSLLTEIKPCLAYYTKLLALTDFLYFEDLNYKDLSADAKLKLLKSTQDIAESLAKSLQNHIIEFYPTFYVAKEKKRLAGLLIKQKSPQL